MLANERTPLQQAIRDMFSDDLDVEFMDATEHPYTCRCESCIKWWVTMGPEEGPDGWTFGPFTEAEFLAAGGTIPNLDEENEEG